MLSNYANDNTLNASGYNLEEEKEVLFNDLNKVTECFSEFLGYEIELRNRVTQNNLTFRVTNSKFFVEILFSSY